MHITCVFYAFEIKVSIYVVYALVLVSVVAYSWKIYTNWKQ